MKTLAVLITLIVSPQTFALNCYTGVDWANREDPKTIRCAFEDRLRNQERKSNQHHLLSNFWNYTLGNFTFKFDTSISENIWTPRVNNTLASVIALSESEVAGITGTSRSDLMKKIEIKDKLLKYAFDPGMTPEQTNAVIVGVHNLINKLLISNNQESVKLNTKLFGEMLRDNNEFASVQAAIKSIEVDQEKMEKVIAKKLKEIVERNLMTIMQNDPTLRGLNERLKVLEELNDGSQENLRNIRSIKKEIKEEKAKLVEAYPYKKYQRMLEETSYTVTIITTVLSLDHPEKAAKINTIAQASIQIGMNVNKILAQSGAATASMGPYAGIAVAAFEIFKSLKAKKNNPHQMIMEQIRKLSLQIDDLRKEVHERFDRVEKILGEMYIGIMDRMYSLHVDIIDTNRRVQNIENTLKILRSQFERIDNLLYTYTQEGISRPYLAFQKRCLRWNDLYHSEITLNKLQDCIDGFFDWSTEFSKYSAIAGMGVSNSGTQSWFENISKEVRTNDYAYSINTIASAVGFKRPLPNPVSWGSGIISILDLRSLYPKYGNQLKDLAIDEMKLSGSDINDFVVKTFKDKEAFGQIKFAKTETDNILTYLRKRKLEFYNDKFSKIRTESFSNINSYIKNFPADSIETEKVKALQENWEKDGIEKTYDALLKTDTTSNNGLVTHRELKPCGKSSFRIRNQWRSYNSPFTVKDKLLMSQALSSSIIPRSLLLAELQNKIKIDFCYEPILTVIVKQITMRCVHCPINYYFDNSFNGFEITGTLNDGTVFFKSKTEFDVPETLGMNVANYTFTGARELWNDTFDPASYHTVNLLSQNTIDQTEILNRFETTESNMKKALNNYLLESLDQADMINSMTRLDARVKLTRGLAYFNINQSYVNDMDLRYRLTSGAILMNKTELDQFIRSSLKTDDYIYDMKTKNDEILDEIEKLQAHLKKLYSGEAQPYSNVDIVLDQIKNYKELFIY